MAKTTNKIFVLASLSLFFLISAGFVLAMEIDYPQVPGATAPSAKDLPGYIRYIFNFSIWIAGFVAFAVMIAGGVRYLTSAGNPSVTGDAKDQIFAGILGLIILLSSYIILSTLNPQLLFFDITVLKLGTPPEAPEPLPLAEKQTLYATEIPLGELIDGVGKTADGGSATSPFYIYEGVLAKTRIARITKLSEETWDTSKKIWEASRDTNEAAATLAALSQQCVCGNCQQSCGSCDNCPGSCSGDPCGPVRGAMAEQQAILSARAAVLAALRTKLEGFTEKLNLEKEKLQNALNELEKAEQMATLCQASFGERRKVKSLMLATDFWAYKESMEGKKIIKAVEIQRIWENIRGENDDATFYCSETPFDVSLTEEAAKTDPAESKYLVSENSYGHKVFCNKEIAIGQAIDNTEEIAEKTIEEFGQAAEEIPKFAEEIGQEKTNAIALAPLPNCSSCQAWCSCSCSPIMVCCAVNEDDECVATCCAGCSLNQPCQGSPCPDEKAQMASLAGAIAQNHQNITGYHDKMTEIDDEIHNLIKGNEIHDDAKKTDPAPDGLREPTWAENIANKELPAVRMAFNKCRNTAEEWAKSLSGATILTKNILTCDEAQYTCSDLEDNYVCHDKNDQKAFADYFCGEVKNK
jgi:hypothetical protein